MILHISGFFRCLQASLNARCCCAQEDRADPCAGALLRNYLIAFHKSDDEFSCWHTMESSDVFHMYLFPYHCQEDLACNEVLLYLLLFFYFLN
jgi:hypothetical protein